jgi:NADH:ubiquinone oxidoreductase subunit 6 (subunit J)
MLDIKYRELQISKQYFPLGILLGFSVFFEMYRAFSKIFSNNTNVSLIPHNVYINWYDNLDVLSDIYVFGQIFYTHYVLQILIAGLILYLAVIGVSFLTVKASFEKTKQDQSIFRQLSRINVFKI